MDFWTITLLATVAATGLFVFLSLKYGKSDSDVLDEETALYRNRVAAIDQDEKLGRLDAADAESIRVMEAKKLLETSNVAGKSCSSGKNPRRIILVASALSVIAFATIFYRQTAIYSPQFQIFVSPNPVEEQSFIDLLRGAESRLALNPDDDKGWRVLAPVYMSMGQAEKGIAAFRKAISLSGRNPELLTALGEAIVVKNAGRVNDEALQLFNEANQLNPEYDLARYYRGLYDAQNDNSARAITIWNSILERNPDDQEWASFLEERIAGLKKSTALAATPELDQETIDAASGLEQSEQQAMINQMVASLAQRLEENPDDKLGWERLIRSYIVLGRKSDTLEAIKKAKEQFPDSAEFLSKLDQIESSL